MVFRGATAIAGIGQTPYYKRGSAPEHEMKLCLRAIVAACEDAGISPREIDGFVSYGSDKNNPHKLFHALGVREVRLASLVWIHGGGIPAAVGLAANAIVAGQAEVVVVYRAMAEGKTQRLRVVVSQHDIATHYLVNGADPPVQPCAMRSQRMIEADGVPRSTLKALAQAAYYHAKNNPSAYGRNVTLDDETYESSRMIVEPYHIFDCSRENDGAAAVIVVSAERAKHLKQKPAYVLSAPMGALENWGSLEYLENQKPYGSVGFGGVAKRLWAESGCKPSDVDVMQLYENFTGMAVAALIDHGFCTAETAGDFVTFENLIAPNGKLPTNTSGGSLADGFIHGMGLVPEAVRQIRGTSCNQVPGAALSMMTGGPGDSFVSSMLLGSDETL